MMPLRMITSARTSNKCMSLVKEAFLREEIVPDLLQVAPKSVCDVQFSNGKSATLGNKISPLEARYQPMVRWDADPSKYYFLIKINPDMPTRALPWMGEFHNWLVVNIPGNRVEFGDTRYMYIPPAPTKNSWQRFVYLVFAQPSFLDFAMPHLKAVVSTSRVSHCLSELINEYELGEPVAGNFFESTWDPYVPMLRQKIGNNVNMKRGGEY